MEDAQLQARLDAARRHVAEQRERLRAARRRLRELEAAASARSDRATARVLRARGDRSAAPPVPPHPPEWLSDGRPRALIVPRWSVAVGDLYDRGRLSQQPPPSRMPPLEALGQDAAWSLLATPPPPRS